MESLEEILTEAAQAQGLALEPAARTRLARYAVRVVQWNRTANLTGARDAAVFCRRFITDALAVVPLIAGRSIVDVGSGNGLPGLVLAVLKPESQVWLVEPRARRARFLRQMRIELELDNLQVIDARVEQWQPAVPPDAIVAQAVGDLAYLLEATRHLQRGGCKLYALKGQAPISEIAALGSLSEACTITPLVVPGWTDRHLVTVDCARL